MNKDAESKKVPKLRFKEFSGEWVEKKLGDVSAFSKGKGISKNDISENGIECIRYGELYTKYSETINEIHSKTNLRIDDLVLSKSGDIIIPASGETAIDIATASCVMKDNVALSGDINIIRTLQNGVYLSYYLNNSKKYEIARLSQGISVIHLYSSQLKTLKINLPTLPEQQKIADCLSTWDDSIENLKSLVENKKLYKKGMMQKLFSQEVRFKDDDGSDYPEWVEKNVTSIAKTSIGLVTTMTTSYVEDGVYLIRNSDIKPNKINIKKLINLDFAFDEKNKTRRLQKNDVVTVHTGDIGVSAVISSKLDGAQGFATLNTRIKNTNEISPDYLCWYYNSEKNIKYAKAMSTGDGRSNYNLKDFNKAIIPVPCLAEQTKIANFLSALDDEIELLEQELEQLQLQKKGLMQGMFV
ncbi:hypothetical protein LO80_00235 [Candidatus Francisella endociliophora]|uniref:Type I restriction modification DNA specificity domain-containing protein n=1 Tax=Candidatus Francisella endociliophora TaxID=653937 RepID=A0A097ELV6_9GAMM|nr:restriction endonuclease subunit S [Francisella sp. FSC1006]AIT08551.1 hypothetical protein LO80_00235 [Francisella sp. FSC1006]